jgi:hypothetical protein
MLRHPLDFRKVFYFMLLISMGGGYHTVLLSHNSNNKMLVTCYDSLKLESRGASGFQAIGFPPAKAARSGGPLLPDQGTPDAQLPVLRLRGGAQSKKPPARSWKQHSEHHRRIRKASLRRNRHAERDPDLNVSVMRPRACVS